MKITMKKLSFNDWMMGYGLIKILLLVAFFASFSLIESHAANSENAEACEGKNLLSVLKEENPEKYKSVIDEAAKVENNGSLFWKIEKEGQPISYLFGTMHMADPEIATIPEKVKQVILDSDEIVVETLDALDPAKSQEAMQSVMHLALLKEGTLRDLVADDLEDKLASAVEARGLPMYLADRMQPWLISTMVSIPICEVNRKKDGALVLDAAIVAYAKEHSKEVGGLETATEQLEAIATIPTEFHVASLEETLASDGLALDMIKTLKDLYLEGQIGLAFPLMETVMPKSSSGDRAARFQEILVEKRNVLMVERMLPILEKKKSLIAVGALHVPYGDGIVALLKAKGYSVTPVK